MRDGTAFEARARIERERVRRDDVEAPGIVLGDLLQRRNGALIALDGDHASGAECQQCARQAARPRTDFQHRHAGERTRRAPDARGQVEVEKEILSERFSGDEIMPANDVAQRRQAVRRSGHDAGSRAWLSALASRAASRSAATRLVASAAPVPAMSKAVP